MAVKTPTLSAGIRPPLIRGAAALAADLSRGCPMAEIVAGLSGPFGSEAEIVAAALDTAVLALLTGQRELGLALQQDALVQARLFRIVPLAVGEGQRRLRLLGFVAAGDLQTNMPIEFITAHLPVCLDLLFVSAEEGLPAEVPEHDVAVCLVGDGRHAVLRRLAAQLEAWPRPVLNHPGRALGGHTEALSRDGMAAMFAGSNTILAPPARTHDRATIAAALAGKAPLTALLPGASWPILVRPEGAHAGRLLELLRGADELAVYLQAVSAPRFTLTQFIDYRSPDGYYRKRRIALIDGEAFLCHMAISHDWMIHYANAGMLESAPKRAEEAAAMREFDTGFARRHRAGLLGIGTGLGLDYVLIDCAEAPDGRLLLFEVEMAAIIHALDPVEQFAYKQPQMQRVFEAFGAMLERAAGVMVGGEA
jgi:hypothetical protein